MKHSTQILLFFILYIIIYIFSLQKNKIYQINHEINSFKLEKYRYLFFDIFLKNNELILIIPVYSKDISFIDNIIIINNNIKLKLAKIIKKIFHEPIIILKYNFYTNKIINTFEVKYNNLSRKFKLKKITTYTNKKLTLTTLFKDDYYLFNMFYNYYIKQGVEHFYLYYNGIANENIKKIMKKKNLTLINWNFRYWNDVKYEFKHHAQPAQIHHAIYKYGKNASKYMIFCDFDEYMHIKDRKLTDLIKTNYDTYGFLNRWTDILTDIVPKTFPNVIKIDNKLKFIDRSKCIHKVDSIKTINIHYQNIKNTFWNKIFYKIDKKYDLFHIINFKKRDDIKITPSITYTLSNKNLKLTFIHIPKTAGSSFFQSIDTNNLRVINHFEALSFKYKDLHAYKITIVRNPYDRCLSAYNYLKLGGLQNEIDIKYKNMLSEYDSFIDFTKDLHILSEKIIHLMPQYKFIFNKDKLLVNEILYFENISNNFNELCKNIKIKCNKKIKLINNKHHDPYYLYYDKHAQDLVYDVYKKDFQLLNYKYILYTSN
tara:strand:+ start:2219 stop:3841 length:1623 start_codon:yes stop_codon:yes gene_type:complete